MLLLCEPLVVGNGGLNGSHLLNEKVWGLLKGGLDVLILAVSVSKAEQTSQESLGWLIEVLLNLVVEFLYLLITLSGKDQFWSDKHLEYNYSNTPSIPQVVTFLDSCENVLKAGAVRCIDGGWLAYIVKHSTGISQVIEDDWLCLLVVEHCRGLDSSKHYLLLGQLKLAVHQPTNDLLWMLFEQVSVSHDLSQGQSWSCDLDAYFIASLSETFVLWQIAEALLLGHAGQS